MPKVVNTRKQRARKLKARLLTGPSFHSYGNVDLTEEEAHRQYTRWAESWIIEELVDLVPELKAEKKAAEKAVLAARRKRHGLTI